MKKIAIATFVKTPGHSPLKTRLAKDIGVTRALEFYVTSLNQTFKTIEELKLKMEAQAQVTAFWAVAESAALESPFWRKWPRLSQGEGDLGRRLAKVYSELKEKFDVVVLYGADSPHIDSDRLRLALVPILQGQTQTVVGPTEDGGFYVLASSLSVPEKVWRQVVYSQPDTLSQLSVAWPEKWELIAQDYDIDTEEDLTRLALEDVVFGKFKTEI